MRTRGHSLSVHASAEQGSPRATAEGELTEAEEEPNRHGNEWLKAMNRDRIHSQVEVKSEKRRRKYQNPDREEDGIHKEEGNKVREKQEEREGQANTTEASSTTELERFEPPHRGICPG